MGILMILFDDEHHIRLMQCYYDRFFLGYFLKINMLDELVEPVNE